jgi:hypothetical protein
MSNCRSTATGALGVVTQMRACLGASSTGVTGSWARRAAADRSDSLWISAV